MKIKRGSTSVRRLIFIADSSSTTGAGLANLAHNSAGLAAYYFAGDLSNEVQITLATATLGTYTSGGFVAVDNTNMPGWYEIGIPDAALDGGNECAIQLRGATNMVPVNLYIELDTVDYQVARFGASDGTGVTLAADQAVNVTKVNGTSQTAGDLAALLATLSSYVDTEVAAIKAKTDNLPVDPADASDIAASFTTVNNTLATIAAYIDTEVAAIKAKTDNLPSDPADQSAVEAAISAAIATVPTAAQNADAVWDEAMADHTGSTTYGGRIVRATNSNVSVQITGSNHIASDVHAFQTDVIDATAFASSAVAEIQSGLATSTALTSVASEVTGIKTKTDNLPSDPADQSAVEAAITSAVSPLATQSSLNTLIQYVDTEVAAIKAVTDKVDTMIEVDGLVYRYTTNALEQAPAGGGGGGTDWTANERTAIRTILGIPGSGTTPADPSDGVLYDIKQKTDQIGSAGAITNLLAGAVLDPGTITSFPSELVIGDSYQETDGREIQIPLVDTDGNVLTTVGSRNLADATATFEIRRINESDSTRVITGVATIVDPPGTGTGAGAPYAIVELPADETAKGLVSYRYRGKLTLTWSGPGTDVYSFDTETIKFTY